jgi:hypothetical protein
MTVADLRQYFENLARLVRASPAAKAADELDHIGRGLAPFASMPLNDFSEFLVRAEEFARTGQVSAAPAKGRARSTGGATAAAKSKPDASGLGQEAKRLYDQAATASVSEADLQALATNLNKLTKDGLISVCNDIGMIVKKGLKKDEIIREIRGRIEGRHGSKQRSGMTAPPTTSSVPVNSSGSFAAPEELPVSV